jgi:hypothetical protein
VVSSATQSMLGCSPTKAFYMDIVDKMLVEFQGQLERHSHLKKLGMRIYDLILQLPSGQV